MSNGKSKKREETLEGLIASLIESVKLSALYCFHVSSHYQLPMYKSTLYLV